MSFPQPENIIVTTEGLRLEHATKLESLVDTAMSLLNRAQCVYHGAGLKLDRPNSVDEAWVALYHVHQRYQSLVRTLSGKIPADDCQPGVALAERE